MTTIMTNPILAPAAPAPAASSNDAQQTASGFDAALQKANQANQAQGNSSGQDAQKDDQSAPPPSANANQTSGKQDSTAAADKTSGKDDDTSVASDLAGVAQDAAWLAQWAAFMPPVAAAAQVVAAVIPPQAPATAPAPTDGVAGVQAAAVPPQPPASTAPAAAAAGSFQLATAAANETADDVPAFPQTAPAAKSEGAAVAPQPGIVPQVRGDQAGGQSGQSTAGNDRGQAPDTELPELRAGLQATAHAASAPIDTHEAQASAPVHGATAATSTASVTPTVMASVTPPVHAPAASATAPVVPGAPASLNNPALQTRIDEALRWMAGDGLQTAQLRVTPDALGPITIHLRMDGDVANVVFGSNHATTREALESSFAGLKDSLSGGGLSLGQASVGSEQQSSLLAQQQQQQAGGDSRLADGRPLSRETANGATKDGNADPTAAAPRPARPDRVLDMYA